MLDFLHKLFAVDFMAHVYCLRLPEVIWLHVTSDLLIAASYFVIPLALLSLVRRRDDLAFSWMFLLFGVFILACGTTHLLSVWTLWHPMYRLEGVVKALTALASMPTALLLFRLLPQVSALPSPARLRAEIAERKVAEQRALTLNAQLEGLVEDRTAELKEINTRLRESEARFRAAAEAATNIIWTNDVDGRMTGEQPGWSAFTGQTRNEYEGHGWSAKVHPEDVQPTIDSWMRAVSERRKFVFEHRVQRVDGAWRVCKINAVPILDDHGDPAEWVGTHTDITEQREAEQEAVRAKVAAEQADSAKSSFLASMSHELRTPLNAIIGYSEMLEEELQESGQAPYITDLRKVRNSGKQLLELINDLLDLRKIEESRMEVDPETIDLSELVKDISDTAHGLMQRNGNHFEVHVQPGIGAMHSDVAKVRQSLLNLLSNAAKFTERGRITLDVEADEREVVFRVTDTGIGISNEKWSKLFEPFSQADLSISRVYGGTGLGLALSRRYCRLLGGDITLTSAPGEGSIFTIRLPRWYGDYRMEPANNGSGVR